MKTPLTAVVALTTLVFAAPAFTVGCSAEVDDELDHWVYVGDSTNDARMFAHFANSVGVANVARFWDALSHHPRYVADGERGAGFAEVVTAVLAARGR